VIRCVLRYMHEHERKQAHNRRQKLSGASFALCLVRFSLVCKSWRKAVDAQVSWCGSTGICILNSRYLSLVSERVPQVFSQPQHLGRLCQRRQQKKASLTSRSGSAHCVCRDVQLSDYL
jgi:hypothetical protein